MADVSKLVTVDITRETSVPSSDAFGIGAVMAMFTPGNLNTPMQGVNGRYKNYVSTAVMLQDGWTEDDLVYRAALSYFDNPEKPERFVVGLRKPADNNWADALDAIRADFDDWYGFNCLLTEAERANPTILADTIVGIADWTEDKTKIFGFETSEPGVIGSLVIATSGIFTSGKPGALANFQAVQNGHFTIAKDGAAAVLVKDINLSASATAGEFESGSLSGNLANFQLVDDGSLSVNLDGAGGVDVTGIDFSAVGNFASVAATLQAAISAVGSLSGVTVRYDAAVTKIIFSSDTTGSSSSIVVSTAGTPSGTDLIAASLLNGGVSEPGDAAASVTDYDGVATALQAAIVAASVTGVTVAYDSSDLRFIFTSDTSGSDSSVVLASQADESGEDLFGTDYLNGGIATQGTDVGSNPGNTDVGTVLKGKYDRTFGMYHEKAYDAAGIAVADVSLITIGWMGYLFTFDPAEATWAYKDFDDNDYIEVSTISNDADEFARGNNINTYTAAGTDNVTLDGVVVGGEYLDIIRGTDWLISRLREQAFRPMKDNPKVPFTDGGIGLIENAIRGVLTEAAVNLINAADTELTVPVAADVAMANKAARNATGFEFSSTYQGAIQKVGISGTIGL